MELLVLTVRRSYIGSRELHHSGIPKPQCLLVESVESLYLNIKSMADGCKTSLNQRHGGANRVPGYAD